MDIAAWVASGLATRKPAEILTMPEAAGPAPYYLSTGNTLLDLALTGEIGKGVGAGHYVFFVGASSSGKTWQSWQLLAEAAHNPAFDKHLLFFDNAENGSLFDVGRYFGQKTAARVNTPFEGGKSSRKLEEFYLTMRRLQTAGQPFVYVLDSMDALSTDYEEAKQAELDTQTAGGTKAKKDFGDGKANMNSRNLRGVVQGLQDTGSILVIICQEKDNVGAGMFDPQTTRAGGRAVKYYATSEVWTRLGGAIKKTAFGNEVPIGNYVNFAIKKNRNSGRTIPISIPFLVGHGFDEIGSLVDFLCEWKAWPRDGGISPSGYNFKGNREAVVEWILSTPGLKAEIQAQCAARWADILEKLEPTREERYA
jgi:RecA/RadA recombinase